MKETFSSTEAARVVELATLTEFQDVKLRAWKQREHMPYLPEERMGLKQLEQLALQAELVKFGLGPRMAGKIAFSLTPETVRVRADLDESCLLGIGFYHGYDMRFALGKDGATFDLPGILRSQISLGPDGKLVIQAVPVDELDKKPEAIFIIDAFALLQRVDRAIVQLFGNEAE